MAIIARFASVRPAAAPQSQAGIQPRHAHPDAPAAGPPVTRTTPAAAHPAGAAARPSRGERCDGARGGAHGPRARPGRPPRPAPVNTAASRRARIQVVRATKCAEPGAARDQAAARLMPAQHAATSAATDGGSDSGAQPAGSARATSSKRTAISWGDVVLTCRENRATCPSWRKSRCAANLLRSRLHRYALTIPEAARAPYGTAAAHNGSQRSQKESVSIGARRCRQRCVAMRDIN